MQLEYSAANCAGALYTCWHVRVRRFPAAHYAGALCVSMTDEERRMHANNSLSHASQGIKGQT